ncbi:Uncharacterised protein [Vibrio cholerae]|nr:Uncharacterised protein [Vibrio cholerae]CSB91858.1 Uncharacterised protein [Vibrio cholerae]CSI56133.1 Uncharacterised protein [Vibrio cholerae]
MTATRVIDRLHFLQCRLPAQRLRLSCTTSLLSIPLFAKGAAHPR